MPNPIKNTLKPNSDMGLTAVKITRLLRDFYATFLKKCIFM
ncbi:hypothetical protein BTEBP_320007 [Brochothrix thermosphacta]|nr:hypothetical protein BTEBP_320007 [Brochothrix thermosphacta]